MRKIVVTITVAAMFIVALPSFSASSLNLPLTIEQVWYRTEKKRGVRWSEESWRFDDFTEDSVDYSARKESFSTPSRVDPWNISWKDARRRRYGLDIASSRIL